MSAWSREHLTTQQISNLCHRLGSPCPWGEPGVASRVPIMADIHTTITTPVEPFMFHSEDFVQWEILYNNAKDT